MGIVSTISRLPTAVLPRSTSRSRRRLLDPAAAGFLARTTGLSVDASFFVTNLASLAVLVSVGLSLILRQIRSVGFARAIVLSPMVLIRFREIYLPDCMHAALVALFFLLLVRGAWWYAMPLLFLMQVTRESTVLLTFVVVLVTLYHRNWKLAGTAVLCTLLGMGVVSRYGNQGQGNIHGANTVVYLVGKVPFNFLTNVCGVCMWTNTHAKNDPETYPNEPLVKYELPAWIPTGSSAKSASITLDPTLPLAHVRMLITILGIMPSLVLSVILWKRRHLVLDDGLSQVGLTALVYGTLAFLMSPILGTSVGRYLSYAWPLAWIAAPELLIRYFDADNRLIRRLAWLQAIASWIPLLLLESGVGDAPRNLVAIAVALPCHILAVKMLKQHRIFNDAGKIA